MARQDLNGIKDFISWARGQGAVTISVGDVSVVFGAPVVRLETEDVAVARNLAPTPEALSDFDQYVQKRFGVPTNELLGG
jgi:hypothetical protein